MPLTALLGLNEISKSKICSWASYSYKTMEKADLELQGDLLTTQTSQESAVRLKEPSGDFQFTDKPVAEVLSGDTLRLIFQLVDRSDLLALACVSRQFNKISSGDFFFKSIFTNLGSFYDVAHWIAEREPSETVSYKEKCRIRVQSAKNCLHQVKSKGEEDAKLIMVGDTRSGKTTLLIRYTDDHFPDSLPTLYDPFTTSLSLGDTLFSMSLWDTAGADDYRRLRPLSYPQTDLFVICFSIATPSQLERVKTAWVPEIAPYAAFPNCKTILVGTMRDLRNDPTTVEMLAAKGMKPVTEAEGIALAKELDMDAYVETSALTGSGVKTCFRTAAELLLIPESPDLSYQGQTRARRKCLMM